MILNTLPKLDIPEVPRQDLMDEVCAFVGRFPETITEDFKQALTSRLSEALHDAYWFGVRDGKNGLTEGLHGLPTRY